jgi:hypothetical protein
VYLQNCPEIWTEIHNIKLNLVTINKVPNFQLVGKFLLALKNVHARGGNIEGWHKDLAELLGLN